METVVDSFKHKGLIVNIYPDDSPESPREWCNLGTMACWHRNYNLGDQNAFTDPASFLLSLLPEDKAAAYEARCEKEHEKLWQQAKGRMLAYGSTQHLAMTDELNAAQRARLMKAIEKDYIILPLFLYDHSGITMRVGAFCDPWDSGQVGYIYVAKDTVRKEYSSRAVTASVRAKAISCLMSEVETYADYLEGNVCGYVVEDEQGEHLDSCWGFYGLDYCREEAKASAEYQAVKLNDEREGEAVDHD